MARYRTIKPEFWTSEQVVECSTNARLLFVGLWNFCDDYGVHPYSAKRIKMEVFPGDDFSLAQIEAWIGELLKAELLDSYTVLGDPFLVVTGWHHQRIDKPSKKYPSPDEADSPGEFSERYENAPRDSENAPGMVDDQSCLSRKEGKGEEKKRKAAIAASDVQIPSDFDIPEVHQALNDWLAHKRSTGKGYKSPESVARLFGKFASPSEFVEAVDHSIACNYQGVFSPATKSSSQAQPQQKMCAVPTDEELEAAGYKVFQ